MRKKLLAYLLVFAFMISLIAPSNAYAGISEDGTTYTVEEGDSLYEIGKELGLNWRTIAKNNNIAEPYTIHVGQKLAIKEKAATPATTTEPKSQTAPAVEEAEIIHGTTKFSDITYARPDFEGMKATIKSVSPLLNKKNQEKKIKQLCDKLDQDLSDALTMKTYLDIQASHDVTDQKIAAESTLVGSEISSVTNLYSLLCIEILESQYESIIRDDLTEEEIEDIYEISKLLTPEYIELQAKSSDLVALYLNALNTTTVDVNGVAMTQAELYNNTELSYNEKYSYYSQWLQALNQSAGTIYLDLTKVYKEIATLNGFDNVTDYMYDSYDRDYTAKQTRNFSNYVKRYIVPLYFELSSTWTQEEVDLVNSVQGDLTKIEPSFKTYFKEVSPDMYESYKYMKKLGLYSIDATPVKQNLNYTTYFYGLEEPYLSLYTTGSYLDVTSYIHEFGHFNAFYHNGSSLGSNIDICEIHSQANELLFLPYYEAYGDAYQPIVKNQILQILSTIIQGCVYDEFQQYVYSHDLTTVTELNEAFFNIECEYGLVDPSTGYTQDYSWVYVSHTFQMPLYYISYAMSALPSLEIFTDSLTDRDAAIDTYNELVNFGTDYSFLKLLKKTGLNSPFKEASFSTITDALYNFFGLSAEAEAAKPAA